MFENLKALFSNKSTNQLDFSSIKVDMHSHLLPAIDDGVQTLEDSIQIIKRYSEFGYEKIITTPHIMKGTYNNTSSIIREKLAIVQAEIIKQNIPIQLEASSEYFLDAHFLDLLFGNDILSFGKDNYILVELSYLVKHNDFENVMLNISQSRYNPILAHPERYRYFCVNDHKLTQLKKIKDKGVLFQLNLFSVLGMYGNTAKITAEKLIDENLIDFIGTDIHKTKHLANVEACLQNKHIQKLFNSGKLLNKDLL